MSAFELNSSILELLGKSKSFVNALINKKSSVRLYSHFSINQIPDINTPDYWRQLKEGKFIKINTSRLRRSIIKDQGGNLGPIKTGLQDEDIIIIKGYYVNKFIPNTDVPTVRNDYEQYNFSIWRQKLKAYEYTREMFDFYYSYNYDPKYDFYAYDYSSSEPDHYFENVNRFIKNWLDENFIIGYQKVPLNLEGGGGGGGGVVIGGGIREDEIGGGGGGGGGGGTTDPYKGNLYDVFSSANSISFNKSFSWKRPISQVDDPGGTEQNVTHQLKQVKKVKIWWLDNNKYYDYRIKKFRVIAPEASGVLKDPNWSYSDIYQSIYIDILYSNLPIINRTTDNTTGNPVLLSFLHPYFFIPNVSNMQDHIVYAPHNASVALSDFNNQFFNQGHPISKIFCYSFIPGSIRTDDIFITPTDSQYRSPQGFMGPFTSGLRLIHNDSYMFDYLSYVYGTYQSYVSDVYSGYMSVAELARRGDGLFHIDPSSGRPIRVIDRYFANDLCTLIPSALRLNYQEFLPIYVFRSYLMFDLMLNPNSNNPPIVLLKPPTFFRYSLTPKQFNFHFRVPFGYEYYDDNDLNNVMNKTIVDLSFPSIFHEYSGGASGGGGTGGLGGIFINLSGVLGGTSTGGSGLRMVGLSKFSGLHDYHTYLPAYYGINKILNDKITANRNNLINTIISVYQRISLNVSSDFYENIQPAINNNINNWMPFINYGFGHSNINIRGALWSNIYFSKPIVSGILNHFLPDFYQYTNLSKLGMEYPNMSERVKMISNYNYWNHVVYFHNNPNHTNQYRDPNDPLKIYGIRIYPRMFFHHNIDRYTNNLLGAYYFKDLNLNILNDFTNSEYINMLDAFLDMYIASTWAYFSYMYSFVMPLPLQKRYVAYVSDPAEIDPFDSYILSRNYLDHWARFTLYGIAPYEYTGDKVDVDPDNPVSGYGLLYTLPEMPFLIYYMYDQRYPLNANYNWVEPNLEIMLWSDYGLHYGQINKTVGPFHSFIHHASSQQMMKFINSGMMHDTYSPYEPLFPYRDVNTNLPRFDLSPTLKMHSIMRSMQMHDFIKRSQNNIGERPHLIDIPITKVIEPEPTTGENSDSYNCNQPDPNDCTSCYNLDVTDSKYRCRKIAPFPNYSFVELLNYIGYPNKILYNTYMDLGATICGLSPFLYKINNTIDGAYIASHSEIVRKMIPNSQVKWPILIESYIYLKYDNIDQFISDFSYIYSLPYDNWIYYGLYRTFSNDLGSDRFYGNSVDFSDGIIVKSFYNLFAEYGASMWKQSNNLFAATTYWLDFEFGKPMILYFMKFVNLNQSLYSRYTSFIDTMNNFNWSAEFQHYGAAPDDPEAKQSALYTAVVANNYRIYDNIINKHSYYQNDILMGFYLAYLPWNMYLLINLDSDFRPYDDGGNKIVMTDFSNPNKFILAGPWNFQNLILPSFSTGEATMPQAFGFSTPRMWPRPFIAYYYPTVATPNPAYYLEDTIKYEEKSYVGRRPYYVLDVQNSKKPFTIILKVRRYESDGEVLYSTNILGNDFNVLIKDDDIYIRARKNILKFIVPRMKFPNSQRRGMSDILKSYMNDSSKNYESHEIYEQITSGEIYNIDENDSTYKPLMALDYIHPIETGITAGSAYYEITDALLVDTEGVSTDIVDLIDFVTSDLYPYQLDDSDIEIECYGKDNYQSTRLGWSEASYIKIYHEDELARHENKELNINNYKGRIEVIKDALISYGYLDKNNILNLAIRNRSYLSMYQHSTAIRDGYNSPPLYSGTYSYLPAHLSVIGNRFKNIPQDSITISGLSPSEVLRDRPIIYLETLSQNSHIYISSPRSWYNHADGDLNDYNLPLNDDNTYRIFKLYNKQFLNNYLVEADRSNVPLIVTDNPYQPKNIAFLFTSNIIKENSLQSEGEHQNAYAGFWAMEYVGFLNDYAWNKWQVDNKQITEDLTVKLDAFITHGPTRIYNFRVGNNGCQASSLFIYPSSALAYNINPIKITSFSAYINYCLYDGYFNGISKTNIFTSDQLYWPNNVVNIPDNIEVHMSEDYISLIPNFEFRLFPAQISEGSRYELPQIDTVVRLFAPRLNVLSRAVYVLNELPRYRIYPTTRWHTGTNIEDKADDFGFYDILGDPIYSHPPNMAFWNSRSYIDNNFTNFPNSNDLYIKYRDISYNSNLYRYYRYYDAIGTARNSTTTIPYGMQASNGQSIYAEHSIDFYYNRSIMYDTIRYILVLEPKYITSWRRIGILHAPPLDLNGVSMSVINLVYGSVNGQPSDSPLTEYLFNFMPLFVGGSNPFRYFTCLYRNSEYTYAYILRVLNYLRHGIMGHYGYYIQGGYFNNFKFYNDFLYIGAPESDSNLYAYVINNYLGYSYGRIVNPFRYYYVFIRDKTTGNNISTYPHYNEDLKVKEYEKLWPDGQNNGKKYLTRNSATDRFIMINDPHSDDNYPLHKTADIYMGSSIEIPNNMVYNMLISSYIPPIPIFARVEVETNLLKHNDLPNRSPLYGKMPVLYTNNYISYDVPPLGQPIGSSFYTQQYMLTNIPLIFKPNTTSNANLPSLFDRIHYNQEMLLKHYMPPEMYFKDIRAFYNPDYPNNNNLNVERQYEPFYRSVSKLNLIYIGSNLFNVFSGYSSPYVYIFYPYTSLVKDINKPIPQSTNNDKSLTFENIRPLAINRRFNIIENYDFRALKWPNSGFGFFTGFITGNFYYTSTPLLASPLTYRQIQDWMTSNSNLPYEGVLSVQKLIEMLGKNASFNNITYDYIPAVVSHLNRLYGVPDTMAYEVWLMFYHGLSKINESYYYDYIGVLNITRDENFYTIFNTQIYHYINQLSFKFSKYRFKVNTSIGIDIYAGLSFSIDASYIDSKMLLDVAVPRPYNFYPIVTVPNRYASHNRYYREADLLYGNYRINLPIASSAVYIFQNQLDASNISLSDRYKSLFFVGSPFYARSQVANMINIYYVYNDVSAIMNYYQKAPTKNRIIRVPFMKGMRVSSGVVPLGFNATHSYQVGPAGTVAARNYSMLTDRNKGEFVFPARDSNPKLERHNVLARLRQGNSNITSNTQIPHIFSSLNKYNAISESSNSIINSSSWATNPYVIDTITIYPPAVIYDPNITYNRQSFACAELIPSAFELDVNKTNIFYNSSQNLIGKVERVYPVISNINNLGNTRTSLSALGWDCALYKVFRSSILYKDLIPYEFAVSYELFSVSARYNNIFARYPNQLEPHFIADIDNSTLGINENLEHSRLHIMRNRSSRLNAALSNPIHVLSYLSHILGTKAFNNKAVLDARFGQFINYEDDQSWQALYKWYIASPDSELNFFKYKGVIGTNWITFLYTQVPNFGSHNARANEALKWLVSPFHNGIIQYLLSTSYNNIPSLLYSYIYNQVIGDTSSNTLLKINGVLPSNKMIKLYRYVFYAGMYNIVSHNGYSLKLNTVPLGYSDRYQWLDALYLYNRNAPSAYGVSPTNMRFYGNKIAVPILSPIFNPYNTRLLVLYRTSIIASDIEPSPYILKQNPSNKIQEIDDPSKKPFNVEPNTLLHYLTMYYNYDLTGNRVNIYHHPWSFILNYNLNLRYDGSTIFADNLILNGYASINYAYSVPLLSHFPYTLEKRINRSVAEWSLSYTIDSSNQPESSFNTLNSFPALIQGFYNIPRYHLRVHFPGIAQEWVDRYYYIATQQFDAPPNYSGDTPPPANNGIDSYDYRMYLHLKSQQLFFDTIRHLPHIYVYLYNHNNHNNDRHILIDLYAMITNLGIPSGNLRYTRPWAAGFHRHYGAHEINPPGSHNQYNAPINITYRYAELQDSTLPIMVATTASHFMYHPTYMDTGRSFPYVNGKMVSHHHNTIPSDSSLQTIAMTTNLPHCLHVLNSPIKPPEIINYLYDIENLHFYYGLYDHIYRLKMIYYDNSEVQTRQRTIYDSTGQSVQRYYGVTIQTSSIDNQNYGFIYAPGNALFTMPYGGYDQAIIKQGSGPTIANFHHLLDMDPTFTRTYSIQNGLHCYYDDTYYDAGGGQYETDDSMDYEYGVPVSNNHMISHGNPYYESTIGDYFFTNMFLYKEDESDIYEGHAVPHPNFIIFGRSENIYKYKNQPVPEPIYSAPPMTFTYHIEVDLIKSVDNNTGLPDLDNTETIIIRPYQANLLFNEYYVDNDNSELDDSDINEQLKQQLNKQQTWESLFINTCFAQHSFPIVKYSHHNIDYHHHTDFIFSNGGIFAGIRRTAECFTTS